ncbi:MAG: hypothetical protein GEU78_03260 [Actinobacteria bacterium]|nr:hypothetical protein [Actinomycetota bacterium]
MADKSRMRDVFRLRDGRPDTTLEEQLLNECGAMLRHASAAGKRIAPAAAEVLSRLIADRAKHDEGSTDTPWRVTNPGDLRDLAITHHLLARTVAPATPQSITVLNEERPGNKISELLGPVRLVRWMMVLALILLVAFLILLATQDVKPLQELTDGEQGTTSWATNLGSALYVLCAAGLGAIFANLFRANSRIESGVYDPKEESSYSASIVMGMIAGVILARVVSGNVQELDKLTQPLLALLGGFAAPAVHRVLTRMVETIEALVQGSGTEQISAQVEAAAARAAASAEMDRARLTAAAIRLRDDAAAENLPEPFRTKLTSLVGELLPIDDSINSWSEPRARTTNGAGASADQGTNTS